MARISTRNNPLSANGKCGLCYPDIGFLERPAFDLNLSLENRWSKRASGILILLYTYIK